MNTPSNDKYWKWAIIGLAIYNLVVLCQYLPSCEREQLGAHLDTEQEKARAKHLTADSIAAVEYRELAEKKTAQIEALRSDLKTSEGKRKSAEQKAANSAAEHAKNPNLHTCHNALMDCQEQYGTAVYSLAVSERMIAEADSLDKIRVSEIDRQRSVIDTLAEGWRIANVNGADLGRQLQKEKGKRFGFGVSAGYGATKQGLSPQVSVSVNYNIWKF